MAQYKIAVSYAHEDVRFVSNVVRHLTAVLGPDSVFFDRTHSAKLQGHNTPTRLEQIYRTDSEFVVPFASARYISHDWCRREWNWITGRI